MPHQNLNPTNDTTQQRAVRRPEAQVRLLFEKFQAFVDEYRPKISLGGVFIATTQPKEVGSVVACEFKLADGFRLCHAQGDVLWVRPQTTSPDRPAGMGIRFQAIDDDGRKLILKILEEQLKAGGEPFEVERIPADAVLSGGGDIPVLQDDPAASDGGEASVPEPREDPASTHSRMARISPDAPPVVAPAMAAAAFERVASVQSVESFDSLEPTEPVRPAAGAPMAISEESVDFNAPWGEQLPEVPEDMIDPVASQENPVEFGGVASAPDEVDFGTAGEAPAELSFSEDALGQAQSVAELGPISVPDFGAPTPAPGSVTFAAPEPGEIPEFDLIEEVDEPLAASSDDLVIPGPDLATPILPMPEPVPDLSLPEAVVVPEFAAPPDFAAVPATTAPEPVPPVLAPLDRASGSSLPEVDLPEATLPETNMADVISAASSDPMFSEPSIGSLPAEDFAPSPLAPAPMPGLDDTLARQLPEDDFSASGMVPAGGLGADSPPVETSPDLFEAAAGPPPGIGEMDEPLDDPDISSVSWPQPTDAPDVAGESATPEEAWANFEADQEWEQEENETGVKGFLRDFQLTMSESKGRILAVLVILLMVSAGWMFQEKILALVGLDSSPVVQPSPRPEEGAVGEPQVGGEAGEGEGAGEALSPDAAADGEAHQPASTLEDSPPSDSPPSDSPPSDSPPSDSPPSDSPPSSIRSSPSMSASPGQDGDGGGGGSMPSAAKGIRTVTHRQTSEGTEVTIVFDGEFEAERFQYDALTWAPLKEQVALIGIGTIDRGQREIGTLELNRIRLGQHERLVKVVFDFSSGDMTLSRIEPSGDRLLIVVGRKQ